MDSVSNTDLLKWNNIGTYCIYIICTTCVLYVFEISKNSNKITVLFLSGWNVSYPWPCRLPVLWQSVILRPNSEKHVTRQIPKGNKQPLKLSFWGESVNLPNFGILLINYNPKVLTVPKLTELLPCQTFDPVHVPNILSVGLCNVPPYQFSHPVSLHTTPQSDPGLRPAWCLSERPQPDEDTLPEMIALSYLPSPSWFGPAPSCPRWVRDTFLSKSLTTYMCTHKHLNPSHIRSSLALQRCVLPPANKESCDKDMQGFRIIHQKLLQVFVFNLVLIFFY